MPRKEDRSLARREKPVSGSVEDYDPAGDELDDEGPSAADVARFGDVTVKCPECGTELHDDVALCWKCGANVMRTSADSGGMPLWAIVTAVVVVGLFVMGWMVF